MIALYCLTHIIAPALIVAQLAYIVSKAILKRIKKRQRKVKVAKAKADMAAMAECYQWLMLNEVMKGEKG